MNKIKNKYLRSNIEVASIVDSKGEMELFEYILRIEEAEAIRLKKKMYVDVKRRGEIPKKKRVYHSKCYEEKDASNRVLYL